MGQQIVNSLRFDQQPLTGDNQTITLVCPRQYDVERYYINLSTVFNITTAATSLKLGGIHNYIKRIELIASGQTVLRSISGVDLAFLMSATNNFDLFNSSAYRTQPLLTIGANAANVLIPLDLAMSDMLRPKDTNLRAAKLSTLELKITLGSTSDVFVGGVFGATTGSIIGTVDNVLEIPKGDSNAISTPAYLTKITQVDIATTVANANFQQRLPVGNTIRAIMVTQKVSGDVIDPTIKLLNTLQVVRGTDVRAFLPFSQMRANFAKQARYIPANSVFCGIYDFMTRSVGQRGKITDGFRIDGSMDLNAVLDFPATAGGTLTLTIVEYIGAASKAR